MNPGEKLLSLIFHLLDDDIAEPSNNHKLLREIILQLKDEIISQNFLIPDYKTCHKGICSKSFTKGDLTFKCYDCGNDEEFHVYCKDCFILENHKGHRIQYRNDRGGCCDCGDVNILKREGFCQKHKGFDRELSLKQIELIPSRLKLFFELMSEFILKKSMSIFEELELQETYQSTDFNHSKAYFILKTYFDYLRGLCEKYVWIGVLLTEQIFSQELKYFNKFRHNCAVLVKMTYQKQEQICTCKFIEVLFRYGIYLNSDIERLIENFSLQLYSNHEFKKVTARSFLKLSHYFFHCDEVLFEDGDKAPRLCIYNSGLYSIVYQYRSSNILEILWNDKYMRFYFELFHKNIRHLFNRITIKAAYYNLLNIHSFLKILSIDLKLVKIALNQMDFLSILFYEITNHLEDNNLYPDYITDAFSLKLLWLSIETQHTEFQKWAGLVEKDTQIILENLLENNIQIIENFLLYFENSYSANIDREFYITTKQPFLTLGLIISQIIKDNEESSLLRIDSIVAKSLKNYKTPEAFWIEILKIQSFILKKASMMDGEPAYKKEAFYIFNDSMLLSKTNQFIFQFSASRIALSKFELFNLTTNPLELEKDQDTIAFVLRTIILLSKDIKPILTICTPGDIEKSCEALRDGIEGMIQTFLFVFERSPYEIFSDYFEKFEVISDLLDFLKPLSNYLLIDQRSKLLIRKSEDIKYDPIHIYTVIPKIRHIFFEKIQRESELNPSRDIVIGTIVKKASLKFLDRNMKQLYTKPSIINLINQVLLFIYQGITKAENKTVRQTPDLMFLLLSVIHIFVNEQEHSEEKGETEGIINKKNIEILEIIKSSQEFIDFRHTIDKLLLIFRKHSSFEVSIPIEYPVQDKELERKNFIKKKQDEIKKSFEEKQFNFLKKTNLEGMELEGIVCNNKNDKEEDTCLICHTISNSFDNPLCYIGSFFKDNLFQYYDTNPEFLKQKPKFEIILKSCYHKIHRDCLKLAENYFNCPACRTFSNTLLPCISHHIQKLKVPPVEFVNGLDKSQSLLKLFNDFLSKTHGKPGLQTMIENEKGSDLNKKLMELSNTLKEQILMQIYIKNNQNPIHIGNTLLRDFLIYQAEVTFVTDIFHMKKNMEILRILYLLAAQKGIDDSSSFLINILEKLKTFTNINLVKEIKSIKDIEYDFIQLFWETVIFIGENHDEFLAPAIFGLIKTEWKKLIIITAIAVASKGLEEELVSETELKKIEQKLKTDKAFEYALYGVLEPHINQMMALLATIYEVDFEEFCTLDEIPERMDFISKNFGNLLSVNDICIEFPLTYGSRISYEIDKSLRAKFSPVELGETFLDFTINHFNKRCFKCKTFPTVSDKELYLCLICGLCFCEYECLDNFTNSGLINHVVENHDGNTVFTCIIDSKVLYASCHYDFLKENYSVYTIPKGYLYLDYKGQCKSKDGMDFTSFRLDLKFLSKITEDVFERKIPETVFSNVPKQNFF